MIDIFVEIGDDVKEGALLATIDATVYEANVDASRAQIKYQKAQLVDRKANLELAKITYERQKRLHSQDITSLESLQNAKYALTSAQAQLKMLEAQIEQNESDLRAKEANLKYTKIYAPASGTVVSIPAKKGQTLNANQTTPTILTIADLNTMQVKAEVSEADVMQLRDGMEVYFKTLGGNKKHEGFLAKVEPTPTITNNVVLYNAIFDVDNSKKELMSNMSAQVFFVKKSAKDAILVPLSALYDRKRGSATVKKRLSNGLVEEVEVKLGVSNRVSVQIVEGVDKDDELITSNVSGSKLSNKSGIF